MYKKTVVFFNSMLQNVQQSKNVTFDMKNVFNNIFSENGKEHDGILTLEYESAKDWVTLDVLKQDTSFLFCRVGKRKELQSILIRNKNTMESSYILEGEDINTKRLEACTYFYLDYETGIISFLIGNDAPNPSCISYMVESFDRYHFLMINDIISPENVKALLKKGSTLSKIKYSFVIPDDKVLAEIGLSTNQILALRDTDLYEAEITLKSKPRKKITSEPSKINAIINSMKGTPLEKLVKFIGTEPQQSQRDYNFLDKRLVYTVSLEDTKPSDNGKEKLTQDEFQEEIYMKIRNVYLNYKQEILYMANKIVD